MNNKRNLLILIITLSLILVLGSSFAYLVYTKESTNNYVINVGTLEVTFVDSKTNFLTLSDMYPMTDDEGKSLEDELVFQVKNTGNVVADYSVYMDETSTEPEFKTVIKYIVSKDNSDYSEPKVLNDDKYIESSGKLKVGETSEYHVKVWLDENASNTYMDKTFKAKVIVEGNQNLDKGELAINVIKATIGKEGGIIGVKEDASGYNVTKEITDTGDLREYRYSGTGVNNYVYFNCQEGKPQNADNCEKWRIVGVFEDENGEEHLKIVKNEVLKRDIFPATYTVNGIEYKIQYTGSSNDYAYWTNGTGITLYNDWGTAGLQYWLNSEHDDTTNPGYLSKINETAKSMIDEKTKYYLGAVTYDSTYYIKDTPCEAYKNERATECADGKGPSTNNSGGVVTGNSSCRVWANNSATLEGSVALLYPSDYGYSADSAYWNTILGNGKFNGTASSSSWLQTEANHESYEWLLSSSSYGDNGVAGWNTSGSLNRSYSGGNPGGVRPTLYLKSETKIVDGDGTELNAYQLEI